MKPSDLNNASINDRIPQSPPIILPVVTNSPRPLWSVMIPVYNCSEFLKFALESVLIQCSVPDQMQIEVIDDASTDADVAKIVEAIGQGRVAYYRQPKNVGSLRNFETCINRSKGRFIHILHGDDRVRNGFYSAMSKLFALSPSVGAAFCGFSYINERNDVLFDQPSELMDIGILDNCVQRLCERQKIQYVSMVVRREVYEKLGSFYGVEYGEDWEMWVRIASQYPIGYLPEVLAEYRRHSNSISGKSFVAARNMECLEWVMDKIEKYLPEADKKTIMRKCRKFYSHYALTVAKSLWVTKKNKKGARAQIRAGWRLHRDILLIFRIGVLHVRMIVGL